MLRIGDINRLTGRTTEAIRRAERERRIPRSQRDRHGYRVWNEADLPAIYAGLHAEPPTERALREVSAMLDLPDDLEAACEQLAAMIREGVEAVLGREAARS